MRLWRRAKGSGGAVVGALVLAGVAIAGLPVDAAAAAWPDKPVTIVVPAAPGGSNDRAARLMARFLSAELGQPVTVVNRPGGGNLLGHLYFQQQPADGYTILRTTAAPYITVNQVMQGARFTIEDFAPINLPEHGYSLIATALDKPFETIEDVITAIREKPGRISVGVQPTSTDMINLSLFLQALGIPIGDVRIVTYDSGGPVRTGIVGGQFDVGVIGTQGTLHLRDQMRPLMIFAANRIEPWNAPTVVEVARKAGVEPPRFLRGSLQGYLVHTALKTKHPDRWKRLVEAFERISRNPEAIEAHAKQEISLDWIGPDESLKLMMAEHELLLDPSFRQILSPK